MARRSKQQPEPIKCGAKNRCGQPCGRWATPGSRRCHSHGGRVVKFPAGDPRRGGRPPTTRLYSRHLHADELEAYEAAAEMVTLDDEIRLARAKLDWAVAQWVADPKGGAPVYLRTSDGGRQVRVRLWSDVVGEHLNTVRKLFVARAKFQHATSPEDDLMQYDVWLAQKERDRQEDLKDDVAATPKKRKGRGQ